MWERLHHFLPCLQSKNIGLQGDPYLSKRTCLSKLSFDVFHLPITTIHNNTPIRQNQSRCKRTFFHRAGILASNMQFNASRRFSLMMMVPSMASLSSVRVLRTRARTFCILSISCLRKMFIGWKGPIFSSLSLTCHGDIQHMLKIRHIDGTGASEKVPNFVIP